MIVSPFKQLLFNTDSDAEIVNLFLHLLGTPSSRTAIKTAMDAHPDSPSLLSISDVLTGFGVENMVLRVSKENLDKIGISFLAQIKTGDKVSLVVVKQFGDNKVVYRNPNNLHWRTSTKVSFLENYNGIVLVGEVKEGEGQRRNIYASQVVERKRRLSLITCLIVFPVLLFFAILLAFLDHGKSAIIPAVYVFLSFLGAIISSVIVWYEVDGHNSPLRDVCSGSRRINCDTILFSNASRIFGVSWSVLGFGYFTGNLLSLITGGIMHSIAVPLLSTLSLVAVWYTIFSLVYQWKVAKQWCTLCLWIQGILVLQAILTVAAGWRLNIVSAISANTLLEFATYFIFSFLVGILFKETLIKAKSSQYHRKELIKLKYDFQIFYARLRKQRSISESTENLGIVLGNARAKHRIIKVCNPYCRPCAMAHSTMEEILNDNGDVQVQIIFTATNKKSDKRAAPVQHLLAISESTDNRNLRFAMNDWYLMKKKDYSSFANRWPLDEKLDAQEEKIIAMRDWCDKMEIRFTPTYFVDGHQLPEAYDIKDLKYLLKK